jgi:hypothetical protein
VATSVVFNADQDEDDSNSRLVPNVVLVLNECRSILKTFADHCSVGLLMNVTVPCPPFIDIEIDALRD